MDLAAHEKGIRDLADAVTNELNGDGVAHREVAIASMQRLADHLIAEAARAEEEALNDGRPDQEAEAEGDEPVVTVEHPA